MIGFTMHVEHVDSEFYRSRFENALKMAATSAAAAIGETTHLLELLLLEAAPGLGLPELERQLRDATNLDLESIRAAVEELRKLPLKPVPLTEGKTIDPSEEFRRIDEALRTLSQQHVLPNNEAWFRLELQVDGYLTRALISAAHSGADVRPVVLRAEQKLAALSDVTLVQQWSRVQREFADDFGVPRLDTESPWLPAKFLELGSGDQLRQKLARYVVELKPKLVALRIAAGIYSHPIDAIGPARLLAINTTSTPLERDVLRLDLARGISRISAAWTTLLKGKLPALASLLRLDLDTRLLQGADAKAAANELSEASSPAAAAVHEALAFLAAVERFGGARSGIEDVLRRHKLGLEVTLPDSAREVRGCSELVLQKKLCRFLIEQGIYAEGTKFGPFETDLLANVRAMATVIEVKLYPSGKHPTEKSIRANLAQLQDYMDKRPVRPTGTLVVYNFSDTLVVAPNRWIRGRYWICVVNLGSATGSRRQSTLTLDEDYGGRQLIVGTSNDATRGGGQPKGTGRSAVALRPKKSVNR